MNNLESKAAALRVSGPLDRLPLLSTFLGHVNPASTYWYLTAVPELMQLAAARLPDRLGQASGAGS